jgi:hypothetical protein
MKADGLIRHSVGAVENCRFDLPSRIGGPRIQLGAPYANQTAAHEEPERVVLVLRDPRNRVARQQIGSTSKVIPFSSQSKPHVVM